MLMATLPASLHPCRAAVFMRGRRAAAHHRPHRPHTAPSPTNPEPAEVPAPPRPPNVARPARPTQTTPTDPPRSASASPTARSRGIDIQPRRGARNLDLGVEPVAVLLGPDVDDIHLGTHRPPLRRQPPREVPGHASPITSHTRHGKPEAQVSNNTTAQITSGAAVPRLRPTRQIMR